MRKKIIVNLIGGVGNQMFQYALGYALARKLGAVLYCDISAYKEYKIRNFELKKFKSEIKIALEEDVLELCKKRFWGRTKFSEKSLKFNSRFLKIKSSAYLKGYFQSEKYFLDVKDEILDLFSFSDLNFIQNRDLLNEIKKTNSVSINLRLCEYVNNPEVAKIHYVCTKKYYENALTEIKKRVEKPKFFVFSDDIEASREYLPDDIDFVYCDTANWQEDLYFMQNCKHNIVANSSFSWWAAYLNQNPQKIVVAPKKWFADGSKKDYRDIVPKSWIKVKT